MRILNFPRIILDRTILGKTASKGSFFSIIGTYAASKILARSRKKWEKARLDSEQALLEQISSYDIAKGAGKLIRGFLLFNQPDLTVKQAEKRLQKLLREMDQDDNLPEEQARSRFLVSKALFYIEGFKLSHCRYEAYQKAALALLHKNPARKKVTRGDVFEGKVFLPEDLIASTHRVLLMLDQGALSAYIHQVMNRPQLRDDADYMAQLIAMTLQTEGKTLETVINNWFAEYCDFKLEQLNQHETLVSTSMSAATGGLPAMMGMDLLSRAGRILFKK